MNRFLPVDLKTWVIGIVGLVLLTASAFYVRLADAPSLGVGNSPPLPESEVVAVLKGEDGHGFNVRGWPVAEWNGHWVYRDEGNATSLYLFHANGDFAQMLGREGQGPMEFQGISDAVVVGDSLYVHDSMGARFTVIGPNLELVRDFRLPVRTLDIDVSGDRLVFAGTLYDRETAGRGVYFVRPTSGALIGGGLDRFDMIPIEGGVLGWRHIAVHGYNITTYSPDGLLKTFDFAGRLQHEVMTHKPDAWTVDILDPEYRERRGDGELFASYIMDIAPAADGLVWIAFAFPNDDYRNRMRTVDLPDGRTLYHLDLDGMQSQVDLVDPTDGTVHLSLHVDEPVMRLMDQGYIATGRYDELDRVIVTIWRLPKTTTDTP